MNRLMHDNRARAARSSDPCAARSRRGSTIIVAVGVLAVLALVAVSYTVVVRNERRSAQAYATGIDLDGSARVVRDEIGAILTADLFGNKIVTDQVPRQGQLGGQTIRVWPRMFEDGEFFDVPQTAVGSFDQRSADDQQNQRPNIGDPWVIAPLPGQFGPFFPSAPARDDAWLSNNEPFNPLSPLPTGGVQHLDWTTWGQISNINQAYRWVRNGANDTVGVWVRGDGRYADLAQFFLSDVAGENRAGDPGANLIYADRSNGVDAFTNQFNGPSVGLFTTSGPGGVVSLATEVFGIQTHQLAEETSSVGNAGMPELTAFDRRFFTDTDGDYRPDARWTTLDALDGLLGLRWVVAARIVDNSALVNVNTAIEFQDPGNPANVGDGRTPADVDLYRLLSSAVVAPDLRERSYWSPAPAGVLPIVGPGRDADLYRFFGRDSGSWAENPFNQHLVTQLGMDDFTEQYEGAGAIPMPSELMRPGEIVTFQTPDLFQQGAAPPVRFTTRLQRYLQNREFGVSPLQAQTRLLTPYPLSDEAALRAYHGVNYDAITSTLEQRLDHGVVDASGSSPVGGVGPMRVLERTADARQYTANPSQPDLALPNVRAIATDTRRLLTTVNGVADFSPVPVLNDSLVAGRPVFPQSFNTKVRFGEFPHVTPSTVVERRSAQQAVERAFEAFAWALAPLAGHKPLMSPLSETHTGWNLGTDARASRFFYGGDAQNSRGPAWAVAQQFGTPDPRGAYSILRAASLAINLADATDSEDVAVGDTTEDRPTVARLYNIPHPRPYSIDPFASGDARRYTGLPMPPTNDGVMRLGVGFSWGDLRAVTGPSGDPRVPASNTDLLPPEYVGDELEGVTLVGLDRQPFLREVSTFAAYADRAAITGRFVDSDERIDPTDPRERLGSLVAWEVGNPWPHPIDLASYRLMLAVNDAEFLTFNWEDAGDTTIPPGEYVVFYAVQWLDGDLPSQNYMESFEQFWRTEIEARVDPANVRRVSAAGDLAMRDATLDLILTESIPFQDWDNTSTVGLITLNNLNLDPLLNTTVPGAGVLVVDRIAAGSGSGGAFVTLDAAYNLVPSPTPATQRRTGALTMAGSIHRPTESASPGFPAWVIERADENSGNITVPTDTLSSWLVSNANVFIGEPADLPGDQGRASAVELDTVGEEDKGTFSLVLPSFQIFVPNTELRYLSELHQISAFTHMYVHDGPDPTGAILGASIADPAAGGRGTWRTVSEQLGSDAEIFRNGVDVSAGLNPYLGVLDPTRFVLAPANPPPPGTAVGALGPVASSGPANGLPEALAVPLALRVFDAFEALVTPSWRDGSRLVQGRMNINTAPQKNLRMLPLLDPYEPITPLLPRQSDSVVNDRRVPLILEYRQRLGLNGNLRTPTEITNLLGSPMPGSPLRALSPNAEPYTFTGGNGTGDAASRGFVTPGELVILDEWDPVNPSMPNNIVAGGSRRGFLELGSNLTDLTANEPAIPTLAMRRPDSVGATDQVVRPLPNSGGNLALYDGVDDPEERLAIYRAVSNIVTARSDVFSAYFTVRGYAPGAIESIEVDPNPSQDQIAGYMDELRPAYEARYLAVYDRSTVRVPTDRPRVLLFVRLPD